MVAGETQDDGQGFVDAVCDLAMDFVKHDGLRKSSCGGQYGLRWAAYGAEPGGGIPRELAATASFL